jgi:membrane protease YdiL (CAAX protease family)
MAAVHLLALLVILLVVWNQSFILRLKRAKTPETRLRTYWLTMISKWVVTIMVLLVVGPGTLWRAQIGLPESKWLPGGFGLAVLVVVSVAGMLVPFAIARRPAGLTVLLRGVDKLHFILPQSAPERFWWVPLSVTAGICEEILFRGFLLYYLHIEPWKLSLGATIALACLIFGLGHLYQGPAGALGTSVLGFLLFVFFLGTGSLLLPILLHTLTDLRVLLVLKIVEARAVNSARAAPVKR